MSNHLPGLELWESILEQCAIRLLFCLLLFHRRFSVDLSHQIIENLTGEGVQSIIFLKKQKHTKKTDLRLYECNFNILQDPSNWSLQSCDQKFISDNN